MATEESIRVVPDSEDELLSSSPTEALSGSADKLSAAARVPHQGAQDALPRVAHHHQENAESTANASEESVEALSADQENASLDVNTAQRDLLCESDDDSRLQPRPKMVLDDITRLQMASMSTESHSPQLVAEDPQEFPQHSQSQHEVSSFEQRPDMFEDQPDETPRDAVVEPCLQDILYSSTYDINVPLDRVSGLSQARIMKPDIRPCGLSERFNDAEQPPTPRVNVASEGRLEREDKSHMMIHNAEVLHDGLNDECQTLPILDYVAHGQLYKRPKPLALGHVVVQTISHGKAQCPSVELSENLVARSGTEVVSSTSLTDHMACNEVTDGDGFVAQRQSRAVHESALRPPGFLVNTETETKMDSFQLIPGEDHTKATDDLAMQPQRTLSAESYKTGATGEDRTCTRVLSDSAHLGNTELAPQALNTVTDPLCNTPSTVDEAQPSNVTNETEAHRDTPIDGSQHPQSRPSPQEVTVAELKAHKAALLSNLASLSAIQVVIGEHEPMKTDSTDSTDEPTESDIMAAANKIVKEHIKLLHQYNELKDAGQGLMGLIADQRGVRIVEVQEEFGIDAKD